MATPAEHPRHEDLADGARVGHPQIACGTLVRECRVLLCPETEAGGFSIHALDLPGVVSQGETEEEAVANIQESFAAAIAAYHESAMPIPWSNVVVDDIPDGSRELRILVNA